jgi:hypothetical protein
MKGKIIDDSFISRLEAFDLHLDNPMLGFFGGQHRTKTYGQTVEFADFREYVLGDDIRRIDWNLYSRFEKHFIRLFVDERQMHMQIFIDCSASMAKINPEKALFALRAAAGLGYLSVQNMDKTSFKFMKGDFCDDPGGVMSGKSAFYRNLIHLEELEFKGETDLEKAIIGCPSHGYNDGLTVIISDFLSDTNWKKAVDFLLFRRRQVMVIQVLSPEEIDPFNFSGRTMLRDSESEDISDGKNMKMRITRAHMKAYKEALNWFIDDIKAYCNKRGCIFISANCSEPVERLLFGKLLATGTIR